MMVFFSGEQDEIWWEIFESCDLNFKLTTMHVIWSQHICQVWFLRIDLFHPQWSGGQWSLSVTSLYVEVHDVLPLTTSPRVRRCHYLRIDSTLLLLFFKIKQDDTPWTRSYIIIGDEEALIIWMICIFLFSLGIFLHLHRMWYPFYLFTLICFQTVWAFF
jgi:hypothetical protein